MKTAGGILLLIGGALGLIGDIMLLAFGSIASHVVNSGKAHMPPDTLASLRSGIPAMQRETILLSILSLVFLVVGVVAIRSSQAWPGLVAMVLAVLSFFMGNHVTAVLCLIGALLALFGSTSRSIE